MPASILPPSKYSVFDFSPAEVAFSYNHLRPLSVQGCLDITVPTILPKDCVQFVGWSKTVPVTSNFILSRGSIPCMDDIHVFLGDMSAQFTNGYRSVVVEVQGKRDS